MKRYLYAVALVTTACAAEEPATPDNAFHARLMEHASAMIFTADDCWDGDIITGRQKFAGLVELFGCTAGFTHPTDARSLLFIGPDTEGRYRFPARARGTWVHADDLFLTLADEGEPPILHVMRGDEERVQPLFPAYDIVGWWTGYPKNDKPTAPRMTPVDFRYEQRRALEQLRRLERRTGRLIGAGYAWHISDKCVQAGELIAEGNRRIRMDPTLCQEE